MLSKDKKTKRYLFLTALIILFLGIGSVQLLAANNGEWTDEDPTGSALTTTSCSLRVREKQPPGSLLVGVFPGGGSGEYNSLEVDFSADITVSGADTVSSPMSYSIVLMKHPSTTLTAQPANPITGTTAVSGSGGTYTAHISEYWYDLWYNELGLSNVGDTGSYLARLSLTITIDGTTHNIVSDSYQNGVYFTAERTSDASVDVTWGGVGAN